jgi:propanediol dehydratase small subunit
MTDYPLIDGDPDRLRAASGRPLSAIALETAQDLSIADLTISADALRAQAEIARRAGHAPLAANLLRAAELTAVPNEELLKMYAMLRPRRASLAELMGLADLLENHYYAVENARLVREAASAYEARGLLRPG